MNVNFTRSMMAAQRAVAKAVGALTKVNVTFPYHMHLERFSPESTTLDVVFRVEAQFVHGTDGYPPLPDPINVVAYVITGLVTVVRPDGTRVLVRAAKQVRFSTGTDVYKVLFPSGEPELTTAGESESFQHRRIDTGPLRAAISPT